MISLALSALSLVVVAQTEPVLILRASGEAWRPFEQRLVAELQASGLAVSTVEAAIDVSGDIPTQLMTRCRDAGAVAVLWFQPRSDGRVDAWVADKVTHKAVVRTYEQPNSGAERARLALRAVELLHASLLEVRVMPQREQNEFPSEVRRFAEKDLGKPHWIFGTGIGVAFTGRLRPQPLLELQLGYAFTPLVAVELQAISSVFPTRVEDPRSRYGADVGVAIVRAQADVTPLRRGDFALGVTGGTGVLLLWASGDSDLMGIESRSEARVTWLACAGLLAALKVSDGIRVQLLTSLGIAVPQVGVALAGNLQETIGRPIIDVLLRLEFE